MLLSFGIIIVTPEDNLYGFLIYNRSRAIFSRLICFRFSGLYHTLATNVLVITKDALFRVIFNIDSSAKLLSLTKTPFGNFNNSRSPEELSLVCTAYSHCVISVL